LDVRDFERFVEETRRSLMGQAFLYSSNLSDAEDLLQETYVRAWRNWRRVSQLDDRAAWARRVLGNLAVDNWRKQGRRQRRLAATAALPTETPAPDSGRLELIEAFHALPPQQRRALVLHAVVGLSIAEIAVEMGTTEATVRSWLSRGRAAVAAHMAGRPWWANDASGKKGRR
jgi:RNA polymerase sigma-70 factor (ECF subfamily)